MQGTNDAMQLAADSSETDSTSVRALVGDTSVTLGSMNMCEGVSSVQTASSHSSSEGVAKWQPAVQARGRQRWARVVHVVRS